MLPPQGGLITIGDVLIQAALFVDLRSNPLGRHTRRKAQLSITTTILEDAQAASEITLTLVAAEEVSISICELQEKFMSCVKLRNFQKEHLKLAAELSVLSK